MNTWDTRFASCAADEEDVSDTLVRDSLPSQVDDVDQAESQEPSVAPPPANHRAPSSGKLSFRELIFTAEGKVRPQYSERSSVSSMFSIGTRIVNGKLHDIEAYAESEMYDPRGRDWNAYLASTGRATASSKSSGLLS